MEARRTIPPTSAFFDPRTAPAFACNLLAGKQWATTPGITGFALVQGTVGTNLTSRVLGVPFGVGFGGIRYVAQGHRLWVFFVSLCLTVGRSS
jgi:hypothetical protein